MTNSKKKNNYVSRNLKTRRVGKLQQRKNEIKLNGSTLQKALVILYNDGNFNITTKNNSPIMENICSYLKIGNSSKNRVKIYNLIRKKKVCECETITTKPCTINDESLSDNDRIIENFNNLADNIHEVEGEQQTRIVQSNCEIILSQEIIHAQVSSESVELVNNYCQSLTQTPIETTRANDDMDVNVLTMILMSPLDSEWLSRGTMNININISGSWSKETLRTAIRNALIKIQNNCVISFGTNNINKPYQQLVQYGKCKYKMHNQKYKFVICGDTMEIWTKGQDIKTHGKIKEFTQLRGQERINSQLQMESMLPYKYFLENNQDVELNLLRVGNTQHIRQPSVLRKARSERLLMQDVVKGCDLMDAIYRSNQKSELDKYVYFAGNPLFIILMRPQNLRFLNRGDGVPVYLDATGGLVRKMKCCEEHKFGRIYYYVCVININNIIFPICELISCEHDTAAIVTFLSKFKKEVERAKPKIRFPKYFVSDWSWVFINSTILIMNSMSLSLYLNKTYSMIIDKTNDKNFIGMFICCSHFSAIIIRQINSKIPNCSNMLREFIMIMFFLILDCSNFNEIDKLFTILCTVCCSQYKSRLFIEVYGQFIEFIKIKVSTPVLESININLGDSSEDENIEQEDNGLTDSPYYTRFFNLYSTIVKEICSIEKSCDLEKNPYFCKDFILFSVKRYFTYLPLWGTIFLKCMGVQIRPANASVENWFNLIKNNIIRKSNLKLGRFIEELKKTNELVRRNIELSDHMVAGKRTPKNIELSNQLTAGKRTPGIKRNIPITPASTPNLHRADEDSPNKLDAEERWERKPNRNKSKYSGRKALNNMVKRKKLVFFEMTNLDYYNKITEAGDCFQIFRFRFDKYREATLTNLCYCSLNGKNYLSANALFVCCNALLIGTNDVFFDMYQQQLVFNENSGTDTMPFRDELLQICKNKNKIYIPFLENGNHWIVVIIDVVSHSVITYDPLNSGAIKHILCKKAITFYNKMQECWGEEKFVFQSRLNYKLPLQRDNYNCGPLICYAVDMLSNSTVINEIHSKSVKEYSKAMIDYRKNLKKIIMERSNCEPSNCIICFNQVNTTQDHKFCEKCKRITHIVCSTQRSDIIQKNKCKYC